MFSNRMRAQRIQLVRHAYTDALRDSLMNRTILVIDDSEAVRTAFDILLSMQGVRTLLAASPAEGLDTLERENVHLVIQDMNFRREATSGEEGVRLFRNIRAALPDVPVILLTAWTHLETAVELVKEGAADYISKPWDDARLLTSVRNLLDLQRAQADAQALRSERAAARSTLAARYDLRQIVYASAAMHTLVSMAAQVAQANVPVLITGPNGAGKEVLADIVHANSGVRQSTFIKVNIGALPDDLIEAELFGTEAGAFTGARGRPGRFEAADGGTLLLDELGNLSPSGQAKLLRVLQTGQFERLGSNVTRTVKVRVIAATNSDLRQAMRSGAFREDLFFRINVIELAVPRLSERREDILPLARHFLADGFVLAPDAERALLRHSWPGNVRELNNAMQRAALLAGDQTISAAALALPVEACGNSVDPGMPANEEPQVDKLAIEQALIRTAGVVAHAARDLGLSRQALYRRMEKLGLKSGA